MKRTLVGLAALAVVLVGVTQATATAPGTNGRIAYRTYFDVRQSWGAVFVMQPDGSSKKQITHPPRGVVDDQPSWAPDGSLITYTRCKPDLPCHVYAVRPDGTGAHQLGKACAPNARENVCPDDADASFSPGSRKIIFTQSTGVVRHDARGDTWIQHSALTLMDRNGRSRRVVFQGKPWSGDLRYGVFSPDGKHLVFEWDHSGFASPANEKAVFVVDVNGTNLRRLTPWNENDGDNPDWSPDGRWILFHSHVDDAGQQSQFFLIHPDGTGRQQVTHFPTGTHVTSATFSPDGKSIVFAKGPEGGNIDVFTMGVDGTNTQQLTTSRLWESAPAWGP
jgi:Tol biopolymer transport system component